MNSDTVYEPGLGTSGVEIDDTTSSVHREPGPVERFFLAGIGAVASACDTAEDTFDRFVDRGQRVEDEWKERADEVRRQNAGARYRARDYFRGAVDAFLDSISIPNKADVDTVNVKLNILTRKLDELQMQSVGAPRPADVPPVETPETTTGDLTT